MFGNVLLGTIKKYPLSFSSSKHNLTFLLKELIIVDIICLGGKEITSREIQDKYDSLLSAANVIPKSLMEPSESAKGKSKLRVLLNNIVSSNLNHSNGLMKRAEIEVYKNKSRYVYRASICILEDAKHLFDESEEVVNMFDMGAFLRKYSYIPLLLNFLNIKPNYCQINPTHINRHAILMFPVFKNSKNLLRLSFTNITHICDRCVVDFARAETIKLKERKY